MLSSQHYDVLLLAVGNPLKSGVIMDRTLWELTELREMYKFMKRKQTEATISEFCSTQNITWKFIPEHSPHFGGLWEAAVKTMKRHLRRIVSDVKLTFEELSTVLTQIEACMNSRPIAPLHALNH